MSYPGIYQLGVRISRNTDFLGEDVLRRMLFNIAIGNTDDHLRNHAFYKMANTSEYLFTPGYDIVPNTGLQGSHAIALGAFGNSPSRDNIEAAAQRMGVDHARAIKIAGEVLAVTDGWQDRMTKAEVVASDIAILERCFAFQAVVQEFVDRAA